MFNVAGFVLFSDVIRKLCSRIPNKTKFVVGRSIERKISEALEVSDPFPFCQLLVEILNKQ